MKTAILLICAWGAGSARASDAPLPDLQTLRQRLIVNAEKMNKDRENYSCTIREENIELNSDGSVKKKHAVMEDRFFVNGWPVDHVLERDGKTLGGDEAKKERERTDKLVKKFSDAKRASKEEQQMERQLDVVLKAVRFSNGHREVRDGRSTVVYDVAGDPNFHPQKVEERFAQALSGRIWVDEEVGMLRELKLLTERDVKVAIGMANLHKGFQLHVVEQRQPDGVWLTQVAEGSGDARALFMRARFRFREELEGCRLFSVSTQEKIAAPKQNE